MQAGIRTPRKLLGWRRVLISGYPLWPDVVSRVKTLGRWSVLAGLVFSATVAISGSVLFLRNRYGSSESILMPWPQLQQDLTVRAETESEIPYYQEFQMARSQGCPIDLHLLIAYQYLKNKDERNRISEEFPWVSEVVVNDELTNEDLVRKARIFWGKLGFLDDKKFPNRELFGRRSSLDAVNVDIGENLIDNELLASGKRKLEVFDWKKIKKALNIWGIVMFPNMLSRKEITELKASLRIPEFAENAAEVGQGVMASDANIFHSRPEANRLHLPIKGTKASETLAKIHMKLVPIVQSVAESRWGEGSRVWLADARVIVQDNGGIAERGWSKAGRCPEMRDAALIGYTAYIPLDRSPVMPKNEMRKCGIFRVLLGSHILSMEKSKEVLEHFHHRFKVTGGVKNLGQDHTVLLMDNNLLLRGEENPAFTARTYLKITYSVKGKSEKNEGYHPNIGGVFEKLSWIYSR